MEMSAYTRPGIDLITKETIKRVVCKFYKITESELVQDTRKRIYVEPRYIIIYFWRTLLPKGKRPTLAQCGFELARRNQATITVALRTINNWIKTDKDFANRIHEIRRLIRFETCVN